MLEVKKLTKQYNEKYIFKDIFFSLKSKSIVALRGVNGVGKTTLLNILSGVSSYNGEISFDKTSQELNFNEYIEKTSLIPNTPFLYEYLTISEMLDLIISIIDKKYKLEANILKEDLILRLKIDYYMDSLIKNLSLGTKQKVAYIVSFLSKPKLVLIDEPFVNIDEESLNNLLEFIQWYVNNEEALVIFSTHSTNKNIESIITHTMFIESNEKIILMENKVI